MTLVEQFNQLTEKIDALDREGKGESDEAEELRCQTDTLWSRMNSAERAEARKFAVESKQKATNAEEVSQSGSR